MPQHRLKTIKFKGKTYKYKNIVRLAEDLKITREQARKLQKDYRENKTTRFIVNDEGEFLKYDLKDKKPLILQNFLEEKENIKRIRNTKLLDLKVSGYSILKNISSSRPLQITIIGKVGITFSLEEEIKKFSYQLNIEPNQVDDILIKEKVAEEYGVEEEQIDIKNFNILSTYSQQKINIVNMELRQSNPLKLTCLYNDIIMDNVSKNNDCIYKYLSKIHPKISSKKQKQLKTTQDILEYSKNYQIRMVAYDIKGNVIADNYDVKSKGRYKNINFIAHNNHLYPLKNQILDKISPRKKYNCTNIFINNVLEKLKYVIEELNIYPININLDCEMNISSFNYIDNENNYYLVINNPDYKKCELILEKFGLKDQLTAYTTLKNIYKIIEKLYLKSFIDSFLPDNHHFIKSAFNYNNEKNVLEMEELKDIDYTIDTIDKNKCYSWALRSLSFLINCDIKKHNWKLYDGDNIIAHYLYVVKPEMSSILLPSTNIYTGEHLIFSKKEGLKFNIIEVLECDKHDNYYKSLIDDLINKTDMDTFKKIINIMIGKFERNTEILCNRKIIDICNKDQQEVNGGHYMPLNDVYKLQFEFKKDYNILNRKPIAIQIKDKSRVILYNQLKEMKLNTKDIIQVKTDSFTFINRGQDYSKYINENINGWKLENYKAIKPRKVIDKQRTFKYKNTYNMNRFYDCYAGCGKSYFIKSEIDNIYRKNNINDYIILTPSHSTLKEYKKNCYNCNVIQKNTYFNKIPKENNIYIDEMGMLDNKAWNLIYMCYLADKKIHAFGDFKQLLPVLEETTFNKKNFINKVFTYQLNLNSNFRNNFSKEYYDKLINTTNKKWLLNQVIKYSTKNYWEADIIIAYRNKTRKKYNDLMLKKLGFNNKYEPGIKIICCDNELSKKEIFNKFEYTIKSSDDKNIIITDDINDIEISLKEYDNHFELGYCRTLYSVQGDTLNSFYYPLEDKNFLNNRQVYTLISRLKQELLNIPNNYNDFDFEKAEYKKLFKNVLDQILKGHYYLK